ncbi:alkaline phosphatase D family protein [Akkermansiaceae bacterium]|nr:alkaline phosphatase D family protein [Akkermansiaceae bacterium]
MENTKTVGLVGLLLLASFSHADPVGPYVGSVSTTEAHFLYSPGSIEKKLQLSVLSKDGKVVGKAVSTSLKAQDFVAKFHVGGLDDGVDYQYRIDELTADGRAAILLNGADYHFKTIDASRKTKVKAVLLSCVKKKDTAPVWEEIGRLDPDLLCLSGDTPYVDTTNLAKIRAKHRAFLQEAPLARLGRGTPVVGTWDDHDFGLNNGNGLSLGTGAKATRKGFVEYRAHANFGTGDGGVYHKSDLGALEIFHLDPRSFSQLSPSPVDPSQPTCFGKGQWAWIKKSLKESKALFKVLSMGAIWQDKKNGETDDMFTYWYERDALLDFIKEEGIKGVVLHGGDIHVSRYLKHPQRVGYDLHDFIVSPGHNSIIPSLNVYHPSLEWSLVEGQQFITLEVDPTRDDPTLVATFRQPGGKVNHEVIIKHSELVPASEPSLLRAYWSFDEDFGNQSPLGKRLDGKADRGAMIAKGKGIVGAALKIERDKEQYVSIPRSFLDDNSAGHSVSCWIRPTKLPAHGSKARHFILESTAEGKPDNKGAYHLSLELSPSSDGSEIALRTHTHCLVPAVNARAAPTARAQGPFQTSHSRELLKNKWSHLVMVFDSRTIRIYLNGISVALHELAVPGPASEFGGLVIGGHRAGEGRNFDGLIDELSIWQRVLTPKDVALLYGDGRPDSLAN